MTIVEKILARASGAERVKPGDLVVVGVDTVVLYGGNFFPAYWRDLKKVKNPESIVVVERFGGTTMGPLAPANCRIVLLARARTSRNRIKSSLDAVLDGRSPGLSPRLVRILEMT